MNDLVNTPNPESGANAESGWQSFFWFNLVLQIGSVPVYFSMDKYNYINLALDVIVSPLLLLAIYGFAYKKRVMPIIAVYCTILLSLIFDSHSVVNFDFGPLRDLSLDFIVVILLFGALYYFQYLCLYRYAFKSPELWNKV